MSSIIDYLKEGFEDSIQNRLSSSEVKEARAIYRFRVYVEFLKYLENKGEKVQEEYLDYIMDEKVVSQNYRDSSRVAESSQREALPDNCVVCGDSVDEYHHIVPHACGGDTEISNLAGLCSSCHDAVDHAEWHAQNIIESMVVTGPDIS